MTALEILEDTALFYWEDPLGRRAIAEGGCTYLTGDGRMCAVGRYLTEYPEADRLDDMSAALEMLQRCPIFAIEDVTETHDIAAFWEGLQKLHDEARFWSSYAALIDGIEEIIYELPDESHFYIQAWLTVTFGDV